MIRIILFLSVLMLLVLPALAHQDTDDCYDPDETSTYSPRRSHESWGDYYRRNQEQVERQYREPRRDRR